MIKTTLIDASTGTALHTEGYYQEGAEEEARLLIITDIPKYYGVFKTTSYTAQGTTQQVTPKGSGSILLTDIIVTFEKKNLGVVTINFHDDTNTVPIIKATLTDAPCNLSMNFNGRWQGWASAHIDVVISGADSIGTVSIGYVLVPPNDSLSYSAWDSKRTGG
jgi:hypothetical protein